MHTSEKMMGNKKAKAEMGNACAVATNDTKIEENAQLFRKRV